MKIYFKYFFVFIFIFSILAVSTLPVSALDYSGFNDTFHMPISQPNVSENLSYMEVITRDGNGNFFAHVYLISFFATANNVEDNPFCSLYLSPNNIIGEDNKIILSDRDDFSYFTVLEINRYGDVYHYGSSLQGNVYIPWRWYEVVSLKTYGSIYVDPNSNITNYQSGDPYTISYGSDNVSLTLLNAILSTLQNQNNNDVTGAINNQTDKLQQNQDANTDRLLGAGSDVNQPDFNSTNDALGNTVDKIESIEGQYKIDVGETQAALDEGVSFLEGTDMQRASVQVKNWIERFSHDNSIFTGFLISAMVLGLCFWIIGRKAGNR